MAQRFAGDALAEGIGPIALSVLVNLFIEPAFESAVFGMAKLAVHETREAEQIRFTVIIAGKKHAMKLHIGPGDTATPVLTLMLPYEE